jgi:predicted MPP superfamily phosphohydrolase
MPHAALKPRIPPADAITLPSVSPRKARLKNIFRTMAHSPVAHRLFSAMLVLGAPGLGAYAHFVEPTWLKVRRLTIPIKGLPLNLDGLQIVQLSDLHIGSAVPRWLLQHAVDTALALKPDLIVLTGDYVHTRPDDVEDLTLLLQPLQAPLGVFAVLGNHDYAVNYPGDPGIPGIEALVITALERANISVLRNEWHFIGGGRQPLAMLGIDEILSGYARVSPLDEIPAAAPRLILCHNPDIVSFLPENNVDLLLCGHTHGGQVRIPPFPPPLTATKDRRFWGGLSPLGRGHIFVNRGIGYTWRVRLGSRPECVAITLTGVKE